jgi:vesicular inhibitory amino acid transporter
LGDHVVYYRVNYEQVKGRTTRRKRRYIKNYHSVALVVLLGDGIDSLFPGFDLKTTRAISFLILTPMLFLPVRHLSYTSLLGIISAFSIILVMLVDGFGKKEAPGSLIQPAVSTYFRVMFIQS